MLTIYELYLRSNFKLCNMARQKFDLSLRVRMDINHTRILECSATLYKVVGRVPVLTMDLIIDVETSKILKKVCQKFCNLAMNNIYFIDVDVHGLTMRYDCDGLFSNSVYVGDLIALTNSSCSLALLFRILGKSEYVV